MSTKKKKSLKIEMRVEETFKTRIQIVAERKNLSMTGLVSLWVSERLLLEETDHLRLTSPREFNRSYQRDEDDAFDAMMVNAPRPEYKKGKTKAARDKENER